MNNDNSSSVLVVGTYCGLNKGDRLMQEVTINAVLENKLVPLLASPFPKIDKTLYPNTEVVKCGRRNIPASFGKCVLMWLMPFSLRKMYARKNLELNDYVNAKYIIDTSGDMLTEDYGIHVALSHLMPLIYCILLKKKFLILAQSIGPFKKIGYIFDKVLSKATNISTRDEITFKYLSKRGLSNLVDAADLGFLLPSKEYNSGDLNEFMLRQKKIIIGICPSALFFKKFAKSIPEINIKNFCLMLDEIANENNAAFVFLPHVMTPNGKLDDSMFSDQLMKNINAECMVVDSDLSPAEIKSVIATFDCMVSFRMHGSIAALDSFVPTITISYSHKTRGLYEKMGLIEWVVECDSDMNFNLGVKMTELIKKSSEISDYLESVIPAIREQSEINIELIKSM